MYYVLQLVNGLQGQLDEAKQEVEVERAGHLSALHRSYQVDQFFPP